MPRYLFYGGWTEEEHKAILEIMRDCVLKFGGIGTSVPGTGAPATSVPANGATSGAVPSTGAR